MKVTKYNLSVQINPGQRPNLSASGFIQLQNGSRPCREFSLYLHPDLEIVKFSGVEAEVQTLETPHPMGFAGRELKIVYADEIQPGQTVELSMEWQGTLRGIIWGYCMIAFHLVELRDFACWYPLQGGDVQGFSWEMDLNLPARGYPLPVTAVCNGRLLASSEEGGRLLQRWVSEDTTDINIVASSWFQQKKQTQSQRTITMYYAFLSHAQADYMLAQMHAALAFFTEQIGANPKVGALDAVFTPRYAEGGYVYGSLTVMSEPQYLHYLNFPELRPPVSLCGNAHELCHYWWREQVSVDRSTWHDWLMEALTEYWASMFDEHVEPGRARAIYSNYRARLAGLDLLPVSQTLFDSPNRYAIWYLKGSWIIRMLSTYMGAESFGQAVRGFYEKHKGKRAETKDFIACAQAASARDLAPFFRQWLDRPDLPALDLQWTQHGGEVEITITQHTEPFSLDLEVQISLDKQVLKQVTLNEVTQIYKFPVSGQVQAVQLDPGEKTLFKRI